VFLPDTPAPKIIDGRMMNMSISKTALKNRMDLFHNEESPFMQTDPEFSEFFDNFSLDEVLQYGNIGIRTRMIAILSVLIGSQALSEYKVMLEAALNAGLTPVEIKEIVYQSVAYVGFGRSYDFLKATNETLLARGIQLPLEGQSTTTPDTRFEQGLKTHRAIFGEGLAERQTSGPEDERHISRYLAVNCFGDYVSRKGLDLKTRELVTVCLLASQGGCEPQLKGHINGNLLLGNDRATLLSVFTNCFPYIGYPRTLNAIRCLNEVLDAQKKDNA
jgi:4-carboxymuconolactone decarboxylase